jgi:two-component system nitrogen regulation response regulator GlnG
MAPATQTKILRVLQAGEIQRVGGTETIKVDVRVIAATNKDLEAMVKAKSFREDLYYRLNVVRIKMPALRERAEDIPPIIDFCLQNLAKQRKAKVTRVSPEALSMLGRYPWPGNVRELENVIYRSAIIAQGDAILVNDLPAEIRGAVNPGTTLGGEADASNAPFDAIRTTNAENIALASARIAAESIASGEPALTTDRALDFLHANMRRGDEPMLARMERAMIQRTVAAANGDLKAAAAELGLTLAALKKRLGK